MYDVFNAVTAYNTYSNTGGSEFGKTEMSHKAQNLITTHIGRLIDDGREARQAYLDSQTTMNASNTVLVAD